MTGALVSIAANVAHSYVPPKVAPAWWPAGTAWDPKLWHPKLGAVVFAVLWPVALALGTEVLTRIPWPRNGWWQLLRFGGVLPVAAVAAIVSYKHLSALLGFYGEDYLTAHIGPFAIDGLMVVATGALMATAGHGTTARPDTTGHPDTMPDTADTMPDTAVTAPVSAPPMVPVARPEPVVADAVPDSADAVADTADTGPDAWPDMSAGPAYAGQSAPAALVNAPDTADTWANTTPDTAYPGPASAPESALPLWPEYPGADTAPDTADTGADAADTDEADASEWPDTATAVAEIRAAHPGWTSMQIGSHLGVSDRTVRRHLAAAVNGHGTA